MNDFRGPFELVDGLQRITAIWDFVNNELEVFGGHKLKDIDGWEILLRKYDLLFNINDLEHYKDILNWCLEMNSWGNTSYRRRFKQGSASSQ